MAAEIKPIYGIQRTRLSTAVPLRTPYSIYVFPSTYCNFKCVYCAHMFPPDVIKLDVEGAELSVLRGLEQTLKAGRLRELFVEVHPKGMELFGDSADELTKWMESHRYECRWSEARGNQFHQHYVFAG